MMFAQAVDTQSVAYRLGAVTGAIMVGALCGCLPYWIARRRNRSKMAIIALGICTLAGFLQGYTLAIPTSLALTVAVVALPRPRSKWGYSATKEPTIVRPLISAALGCVTFGLVCLFTYSFSEGFKEGYNRAEMRGIAEGLNKSLPVQVTPDVRWERVEGGPGRRLTYIYTVNMKRATIDKERLEEMVFRNVSSREEVRRTFLEKSIALWCRFNDKDANTVHEFAVPLGKSESTGVTARAQPPGNRASSSPPAIAQNGASPEGTQKPASPSPASSPMSTPSVTPSPPPAAVTENKATPPVSKPGAATGLRLRYNFEAGRYFGYDVKIVAESAEYVRTCSGYALYKLLSHEGDRITLRHEGALSTVTKFKSSTISLNDGGPEVYQATIAITPHGDVLPGRIAVSHPLPYALGSVETFIFEELPSQTKPQWRLEHQTEITERRGPGANLPVILTPSGDIMGSGSKATAKETIDYAIAETRGDLITLRKTYRLQTGARNTSFSNFQMSGDGQLVFDSRQGMMTSGAMKYTFVDTDPKKTDTVSISIDYSLMAPSRLDQMANEWEARYLAAQKSAEKERLRQAQEAQEAAKKALAEDAEPSGNFRTWRDSTGKFRIEAKLVSNADGKVTLEKHDGSQVAIPMSRLSASDRVFLRSKIARDAEEAASSKGAAAGGSTDAVGGSSGWQYRSEGRGPVVGIRYRLGSWDGENCVAPIEAVFDRQEAARGRTVIMMARSGYAIGALEVDANRFVNAMRIVFMRLKSGRLDPEDSYTSEWIGTPTGRQPKTITGKGALVIGFYGYNGAVLASVGLILHATAPASSKPIVIE